MSDYNGPTRAVRVRFKREWFGVAAGHESDATFYPELGTYYVPVNQGQHIGGHPSHAGLLEVIDDDPDLEDKLDRPTADTLPGAGAVVHGDELWDGPRMIYFDRTPTWVETKQQYWELLAKHGKRMKDQQESDPGPHYDPPTPVLPIELTPPPPPKLMTQEEAHVWAAMGAVYKRYTLEETLWCKQCAARNRPHGLAVAVTNRRVRYECRCGVAEYVAPRGTTDLLATFANTAITALDRTSARLETPIGSILVPAHILQDREAELIRRYARYLVARDLELWIFCKPCRHPNRAMVMEEDTCALNITHDQIAIVCAKHCRMLFYQGVSVGPTVH